MKPWVRELLIALGGGAACVALIMLTATLAGARAGHSLNAPAFVALLLLLPGTLLSVAVADAFSDNGLLLGVIFFREQRVDLRRARVVVAALSCAAETTPHGVAV